MDYEEFYNAIYALILIGTFFICFISFLIYKTKYRLTKICEMNMIVYYKGEKIHRQNGPAIIYRGGEEWWSGGEEWWIDGKLFKTKNKNGISQYYIDNSKAVCVKRIANKLKIK